VTSMSVCVSVCLYVCLPASIAPEQPVQSSLILFMFPMAVARSSFDGTAICYAFPVLWIMSHLRIMVKSRRREKVYSQNDSTGSNTELEAKYDIYGCLVLARYA